MKILLVAVNSKYIHSNPAVYLLRAYAGSLKKDIDIAEYTINQQTEDILADIHAHRPDVIAFACYIWNIRVVRELLSDLPKILPGVPILLGGPEVSYDAPEVLKAFPNITAVIVGEGEATFRDTAAFYLDPSLASAGKTSTGTNSVGINSVGINSSDTDSFNKNSSDTVSSNKNLSSIPGLCLRGENGEAFYTPARASLSMDEIPFFYDEWAEDPDLGPFKNKILYYETSRGCPFRCSYCLSSIDKHLRLRSIDLVRRELRFFLDHRVHQVKFIDRTFNCNEEHALAIWTFLLENDNGITNFHFEISADLLTERELSVLQKMRPGLIQLEIGVQSTNPDTIREIRRTMDLDLLRKRVALVHSFRNIHQHLDLIAGLPHEDLKSFIQSYNDLYAMQPDQLQLGFLKVLKGAFMKEQEENYGLKYTEEPPYEVLSTHWISYAEIRRLKRVEAMTELYYNSLQFTKTLAVLVPMFESPFAFFDQLASFYEARGYFTNQPSRSYRYQVLLEFLTEKLVSKVDSTEPASAVVSTESASGGDSVNQSSSVDPELIRELLTWDLYLRENAKSRPEFCRDLSPYKKLLHSLEKDRRDHLDIFHYPIWKERPEEIRTPNSFDTVVRFDYQNTDPLNKNASVELLTMHKQ